MVLRELKAQGNGKEELKAQGNGKEWQEVGWKTGR